MIRRRRDIRKYAAAVDGLQIGLRPGHEEIFDHRIFERGSFRCRHTPNYH